MKLRFLFIVMSFIIISIFKTNAQQNVAINTTGAAPDASAILDISSTNKGLLIPRVALTQTSLATPITAPATSLLVYNTATVNDVTPGYYFWDGTAWIRMLSGGIISNDWALLGNAGTNPSTNFLGTTDAQDMVIRTNNTEKMRVESGGNVGIGTNNPNYKLHLYGTSNNAADVYSQTDAARIVKHWFVNANRSWSVGQIGTTQSPNYSFQITDETAGSPRMSITTGGDVGIAETNPVYRLDVRSTFGVALPGVDPNNFIKLNASGASSMAFIAFNDLGRLEFRAQSSSSYSTSGLGASSTIMTIDGTTNHVGIGETSPTQKLTIVENTPFSLGGSDTGVDNIYLENHSMGAGDGNYGGSISFSGPYNGGGGAPRRHAAIVGVQVTTESDYVGLAFFTHNSSVSTGDMQESMRLTHNGNLGIGTTTPTAQLHTTGSVRFQGAGTPAAGRVLTSDANGNATWQDPSGGGDDGDWEVSGNNVYTGHGGLYPSGNVGIGTSTPGQKLSVRATTPSGGYFLGSSIALDWVGTGALAYGLSVNAAKTSASSSGRSTAIIATGGNATNKYNTGLSAVLNGTNEGSAIVTGVETDYPFDGGYYQFQWIGSSLNGQWGLISWSDVYFDKDNYIMGDVGIGTITATKDLHIKQKTTSSGTAGIILEHSTSGNTWSLYHANTENLWFQYNGALSAWIDYTSGVWNTSDRRLKKDFTPLETCLDKVMQLEALEYTFIRSKNNRRDIGFVSQDVEKLFPQLVQEQDGYFFMNYSLFSVIAIKAVQEQQTIIEKQANEIKDLRKQNEEILQRLMEIESKM